MLASTSGETLIARVEKSGTVLFSSVICFLPGRLN
jgi:hypothetical protein